MIRNILSLFLLCAAQSLQADYIIVKRTAAVGASSAMGGAGDVAPITTGPLQAVGPENTTPEQQAELYKIMMTYEWPMSSAAYAFGKITPAEAKELFAPGIDSAEQNFMRRKIHTSPLLGPDFDLVFVPKTLYELMVLDYFLGSLSIKNLFLLVTKYYRILRDQTFDILFGLQRSGRNLFDKTTALKQYFLGFDLATEVFAFEEAYHHDTNREEYDAILSDDAKYGAEDAPISFTESLKERVLLINKALGHEICVLAPTADVAVCEKNIQCNFRSIAGKIIWRLVQKNEALCTKLLHFPDCFSLDKIDLYRELIGDFTRIDWYEKGDYTDVLINDSLLANMIEREYVFKAANYAYVVRGSGGPRDDHSTPFCLKGSLIDAVSYLSSTGAVHNYADGHSLSFGNSLLAGAVSDHTACAYHYSLPRFIVSMSRFEYVKRGSPRCYALEINKRDYVTNNCGGLFFVPPVPTFLGLLGKGEWFHPRTRVLTMNGRKDAIRIGGIDRHTFVVCEPTLFYEHGEPWMQELLFQKYCSEHAYFLRSAIDPAEYLKASRALASAIRAVSESGAPVNAATIAAWQEQQAEKENKAAAVITRALRKNMAVKEPKPAAPKKRARCSAGFD